MQQEAEHSGWFNHRQNPHTSSYESKAMASTVHCMFVCVTGIIDISLNPVVLFLNDSVDITFKPLKTVLVLTSHSLFSLFLHITRAG